jgi:heme/copper-type cytochrome/quinol oxidase subunit 4
MISLFVRFLIVVTVVVSITNTIVFYHIQKDPAKLTILFVILTIIVTIIPIAVNLWYWLIFKLHIG